MPGLRNLAVYGHATTQALQNLRSVNSDFDAWYEPIRNEMKGDPLMKYFWDLRSRILKEGTVGTSGMSGQLTFDSDSLKPLLQNPPPGATGFFIGDDLGGSGWDIELPDGTTQQYYVDLPSEITVEHNFLFEEPPTIHNGEAIEDTSAQGLSRLYVDAVRSIVEQAKARFG
jgi:hypothetical protein